MMESIKDRAPKARRSCGGGRLGSEAETDVGGDDRGGPSSPPRPAAAAGSPSSGATISDVHRAYQLAALAGVVSTGDAAAARRRRMSRGPPARQPLRLPRQRLLSSNIKLIGRTVDYINGGESVMLWRRTTTTSSLRTASE